MKICTRLPDEDATCRAPEIRDPYLVLLVHQNRASPDSATASPPFWLAKC